MVYNSVSAEQKTLSNFVSAEQTLSNFVSAEQTRNIRRRKEERERTYSILKFKVLFF